MQITKRPDKVRVEAIYNKVGEFAEYVCVCKRHGILYFDNENGCPMCSLVDYIGELRNRGGI